MELRVNIDDKLYREADEIFNELGIDLDTAIKLFLKQSVFHRELPFMLTLPSEPVDGTEPIIDDILT